MKIIIISFFIAIFYISCSSTKDELWHIEHEGRLGDTKYSVLRQDNVVLVTVNYDGEQIGLFNIETNRLAASVNAFSPLSGNSLYIASYGDLLQWVRYGTNDIGKWTIHDANGDGLPDMRIIRTKQSNIVEKLSTNVEEVNNAIIEP